MCTTTRKSPALRMHSLAMALRLNKLLHPTNCKVFSVFLGLQNRVLQGLLDKIMSQTAGWHTEAAAARGPAG